jgi:hypothetical protein
MFGSSLFPVVVSMTPTADHSAKRGYFVVNSSGSAALSSAATDIPVGVIIDGEATTGKSSVALSDAAGPARKVKLSGTVAAFAYLQLHTDGSVITDAGTGSRVIVGRALEAGVSGDLIDAVLITPTAKS